MRATVTELDVASYRINGFVTMPGFLTDQELSQLQEAVSALAAGPGEGLVNYRGRRTAFVNSHCADIVLSDEIGGIVARLQGLSSVRYLNDAISFVLPGHGATPWHVNMHEEWPISTPNAISACICLDDYRWNTKAMNFLPGTHLTTPVGVRTPSPSLRPGGTRFDQLFDDYPAYRDIPPVAAECPAGSVIFLNPLGVHGSAPNMTTTTRRILGALYFEDGELYTGWEGLAEHAAYPSAVVGEPLRGPETPIIWPPARREVRRPASGAPSAFHV